MNSTAEDKHAILKRRVEDRMLEWKCKVENPPRKGPDRVTSSSEVSTTDNAIEASQFVLHRLPKIVAFQNPSGGSGAPRRTPSGRIQTELRGHPEIRFHQRDNTVFERSMRYQLDKDQIRRYKEELDKQLADRKKFSLENNGVEKIFSDLATVMSSNVIRRWESLPKLTSTDVTRNYVNSPRTPDAEEYKRGLEIQLENKRLLTREHQKMESNLHSLHFNAFDSFWGKPGAGAPKSSNRKENLFKLLHNIGGSGTRKFPKN